jgi:hypothetical protein
MSALTFLLHVLGYDDPAPTSNPTSRQIDYSMTQAAIPVDNAQTESFNIDPGATFLVFDGVRETSLDDTTVLNLTLNGADASVYRLTYATGTFPNFRTDRDSDCSGIELTLEVLANLTLSVTAGTGNPFVGVQVGDTVFIPGLKTGDSAGPFNDLNCGFWTVLSVVNSAQIVLGRFADTVWEGISEVVTPGGPLDFQTFSPDGVQIGDTVDISAGFSKPVQRAFDLTNVTAGWIEFRSTAPLGPESGVAPTEAGFAIYTQRKRFIGIRTDQEIVVRYNGDTGNSNRVEPWLAGTKGMEGSNHKFGSVWKLEIYNRSTARAQVRVASAE